MHRTAAGGLSDALPTVSLVGVTAAWGSTFFMIKDVLEQISVLDFLSIRFAVAGVFLLAVAPRAVLRLDSTEVRHGVALGVLYGVAQILQTAGLEYAPASVSGFVTGMYVVLTPLLGAVLFRDRIPGVAWLGVAMSTGGLAFLSLDGFSVSWPVMVILSSAGLYALHIVAIDRWSRPSSVMGLSILQMFAISAVCTLATVPDGMSAPRTTGGWLAIIYMAVICGAAAMVLQVWAQTRISATRTAIIMTMEPVFAAFFAVVLGGESVTARLAIGGSLVLAAMFIVELAPRRHVEGEVPHIAT